MKPIVDLHRKVLQYLSYPPIVFASCDVTKSLTQWSFNTYRLLRRIYLLNAVTTHTDHCSLSWQHWSSLCIDGGRRVGRDNETYQRDIEFPNHKLQYVIVKYKPSIEIGSNRKLPFRNGLFSLSSHSHCVNLQKNSTSSKITVGNTLLIQHPGQNTSPPCRT